MIRRNAGSPVAARPFPSMERAARFGTTVRMKGHVPTLRAFRPIRIMMGVSGV